jgi:hypothetical protein
MGTCLEKFIEAAVKSNDWIPMLLKGKQDIPTTWRLFVSYQCPLFVFFWREIVVGVWHHAYFLFLPQMIALM